MEGTACFMGGSAPAGLSTIDSMDQLRAVILEVAAIAAADSDDDQNSTESDSDTTESDLDKCMRPQTSAELPSLPGTPTLDLTTGVALTESDSDATDSDPEFHARASAGKPVQAAEIKKEEEDEEEEEAEGG
ncbi:hypothetical protein BGX28_001300, partial [Mortierella sp. GBA30]